MNRFVHDFTDWPPDEDIADAVDFAETEADRREAFCAAYRRLEAYPVAVGRIADEPRISSRWLLWAPAAGLAIWSALLWWQADNIAAVIASAIIWIGG